MVISQQQARSPYVGRRMTLDEFLELPEQSPPQPGSVACPNR